MFKVDYRNGIVEEIGKATLKQAIQKVNKELFLTKKPVEIRDKTGKLVAVLPWYDYPVWPGVDTFTKEFGDTGFYGEWFIVS